MSEPMAMETLVSSLAELEGYLTAIRVPYFPEQPKRDDDGKILQTKGHPGDLDVVGVKLNKDGKVENLLVAEVKAYSPANDYLHEFGAGLEWLYLVWRLCTNIIWVADERFEGEFGRRSRVPDTIWIVSTLQFHGQEQGMSGHQMRRPWAPFKWAKGDELRYKALIAEFTREKLQKYLEDTATTVSTVLEKSRDADLNKLDEEGELLNALANVITTFLMTNAGIAGFTLKLLPAHVMMRDLIIKVRAQADVQGKRFANPALEMIKWLSRMESAKCIDVQDALTRPLPEKSSKGQ